MPGSTTLRASRSASIMGREWGGEERMVETVDLPVAREPVRARRSMVVGGVGCFVSLSGEGWKDACGVKRIVVLKTERSHKSRERADISRHG